MTFEIGELHPNSPHLFADLAELLLLANHNGRKFLHLNDLESLLNAGSISADEIDEDEYQNVRPLLTTHPPTATGTKILG